MSILKKVSNLTLTTGETKLEMTAKEVEQCKAALKRDLRGPAVQPNKFDRAAPYRVTVNFQDTWTNHGTFSSVDVAAAVGTLVSASVFGEKARSGNYNEAEVEAHDEFKAWLADPRNVDVIARVEAGVCLLDGDVSAVVEELVAEEATGGEDSAAGEKPFIF